MATIANLWVELGLKSGEYHDGLARAERDLDSFTSKAAAAGKKMMGIGKMMTIGLTAPIIAGAAFAVNAASDLAEAQSAAATTYGDMADQVIKKSKEAAEAVFLSQQQYLQAATVLGVYGQGAGLAGQDLVNFGDNAITAAADLSSFYNVPLDDALAAWQSGLSGEAEPMRQFGIFMNEAELQAYALANGLWDGSGAMTEQQKILARQNFMLDHLGPAQGDAARTAGGLANSMRRLQAQFKNAAASIGKYLLPAALKLVTFIGKLFERFEKLSPTLVKFAVVIALAAAVIGPLLFGVGALVAALAPLLTVVGLLLSPIGLLAAGIVALGFVFGPEISGAIGEVSDRLKEFFSDIGKVYDRLRGENAGEPILNSLGQQIGTVEPKVGRLNASIRAFGSALEDLTGIEMSGFFGNLAQAGDALLNRDWSTFWDEIKQAIGPLDLELVPVKLAGFVWDTAVDLWGWVKGQFGLGGSNGMGSLPAGAVGPESVGLLSKNPVSLGELVLAIDGFVWDKYVDVWGWVTSHLFGGGSESGGVGPGSQPGWGGASSKEPFNIGTVLLKITGYAWDHLPDVWEWVKDHIWAIAGGAAGFALGGVPGAAIGALHGSSLDALDLGKVWLTISEFAITSAKTIPGAVVDWVAKEWAAWDRKITLGNWTLDLQRPEIVMSAGVLGDWIQLAIDGVTGTKATLHEWDMATDDPTVTTSSGGKPDKSWLDFILGTQLPKEGDYKLPIINVSANDVRMAGVEIQALGQKLTRFLNTHPGFVAFMNKWTMVIQNPSTLFFAAIDFGKWAEGRIEEKLKGMNPTVGLPSWRLTLPEPILDDLSLLLLPIKILKDVVGIGDIKIGWPNKFKITFPDIDFPDFSGGIENASSIPQRIIGKLPGLGDIDVPWPNGFSIGFPNIDFPDLTWADIKQKAQDLIDVMPDIDIDWTPGFNINFPGFGKSMEAGPDLSGLAHDAMPGGGKAAAFSQALQPPDTSKVSAAFEGLTAKIKATTNDAISHLGAVQQSIGTILTGIATSATNMGQIAGEGFRNTLAAGLNAAVSHAGAAQQSFASIFSGIATSATNLGSAAGEGFASGIRGGMSIAIGAAYGARGAILGALSLPSLFGSGFYVGQSLGAGIAAGIQSMIGSIASSAANAVNQAEAAARQAADAHSPSRLFMALGEDLVSGLMAPLEQAGPRLSWAAMEAMPSVGYEGIGAAGGITVHNTFNAPIYGVDDLENTVTGVFVEKIAPAMAQAKTNQERARGVR